jgi:hypothetical protein
MKSIAGVCALICFVVTGESHAQTAASSLEIIRAQLARQGQIAYSAVTHDSATNQTWTTNFTVEASNVAVDLANCKITFHWHTTVNGKVAADVDSGVPFRLATDVTLISMAEDITNLSIKGGHPTWGTSSQPQIWVVHVERSDNSRNTMDFRDRATAQTVVNAANQVKKLCAH